MAVVSKVTAVIGCVIRAGRRVGRVKVGADEQEGFELQTLETSVWS